MLSSLSSELQRANAGKAKFNCKLAVAISDKHSHCCRREVWTSCTHVTSTAATAAFCKTFIPIVMRMRFCLVICLNSEMEHRTAPRWLHGLSNITPLRANVLYLDNHVARQQWYLDAQNTCPQPRACVSSSLRWRTATRPKPLISNEGGAAVSPQGGTLY